MRRSTSWRPALTVDVGQLENDLWFLVRIARRRDSQHIVVQREGGLVQAVDGRRISTLRKRHGRCDRSPPLSTTEDEAARQLRDQALDAALELTFPASDPIALTVPTPEPATPAATSAGSVARRSRRERRRPDDAQ
ncbi:hypothetical protein HYR54_02065 [Candidatus Acetothermia bacterium]|nr:hypothetical protein [Candidatus Acetothermia bacterium]